MSFRRMLPFLLINIVVSATVMLAILFWWNNRDAEETAVSIPPIPPTATVVLTTAVSPQDNNPPPAEAGTEALPPIEEDPIHIVVAGDTLGILSSTYDVSVEDIITVNNIIDPNILTIGQILTIPINGLPEPTAVPTPVPPTPTPDIPPTPIPAIEETPYGSAVIEISATNSGDIETEAIQIQNLGGQQVSLSGWQMIDADGHTYTFAQITLFGDGAAIQLHTTSGQDAPADLYWGLDEPVLTTGERLSLHNSAGEVVATTIAP